MIYTFHSGAVSAELHSGVLIQTKLLEFRNKKGLKLTFKSKIKLTQWGISLTLQRLTCVR